MTVEMGLELERAVSEINADTSVRVVILTGAGDTFSSGGDLDMIKKLQQHNAEDNTRFMHEFYRSYFSICKLEMPTIALINGHAIGAGFCLALACDLRTIATHARIGLTFVKIGINAGMGGTFTLPRLIGAGRAAELLYTGDLIATDQALDWGLVNRVFSPETLFEETLTWAERIARNAPHALKNTKRCLTSTLNDELEKVFDLEARGQAICYSTHDLSEGIDAVLNKREPQFTGE